MVYTIAEMAWSHNGSFDNAKKILKGTKKSGANAISIHITDMETYMTKDYKCLAGTTLSDSSDSKETVYNYLNKINIRQADWINFNSIANEIAVDLVVMCNDQASFEFSKQLNVEYYVISAASFSEYGLIKNICSFTNKLLLRIGGATLDEIKMVVNLITDTNQNCEIGLLAGIQLYPTPINQLHFKSLIKLAETFKYNTNVKLGIADHINGDNPLSMILPILAIPLNISYIEKHITTDRKEKLEDYEAALGIEQFKEFVNIIRESEVALGDGSIDYLLNDNYGTYREVVRKKIVAKTIIEKGEIVTKDKITFKRSDYGHPLEKLNLILNKKATKRINIDEGITEKEIK